MTMDTGEPDPESYESEGEEDHDGYQPWWSRRKWLVMAAAVVVVVGLGVGLGLGLTGSSGGPSGPEGVPLQNVPDLASADSTLSGAPVDGMTCRKDMAATDPYHVHVHVAIFVNGRQERIPAGAGITLPRASVQVPGGTFFDAGSSDCLYWLHTHADDGIIHVEAPAKRNFTLGEFFDIWGQPLGPDQVGPAHGTVVAFENGQRFQGNPRDIPLDSQAVIQLDVGGPVVSFQPMTFKVIGLCSTSCSALPGS
ncbi:MAG: hypothetical protein M0Z30_16740 [Actinomycetota bacterium]|nr:hypothetical protein [Actinomycetota bacterium]